MQSCPATNAAPVQSDEIRTIARPAFLSFAERAAFEFRLIVTGGGCQGITL